MLASDSLKANYPKLERYIRVEMPKLTKVGGVLRGLQKVLPEEYRFAKALTGLFADQMPLVDVLDGTAYYFIPPTTLKVLKSTAKRFEAGSRHTLRGRWGHVYEVGLELLLGLIEYALFDPTVTFINPDRPEYDAYLQHTYGLSYREYLRARYRD